MSAVVGTVPGDAPLSPTLVAAVAEDLYRLLPAHVRQVDLATGGALRALGGVLAHSSAEIDTELDAYYDALFVETADPQRLRALADLVGAIPLQPLPRGAAFDERAYVANTVRHRRGKGTARVLESLASDVTGTGAVAVEYFHRIARLQHLLDVRPERPATGSLVDGDTAARAGGAFDRLPRLLDVRQVAAPRGHAAGRHGIPSLAVHLVRHPTPVFPAPPGGTVPEAALAGVPRAHPWETSGSGVPGLFQLAAQPGAPLRLFAPDRRGDAETDGDRIRDRDLGDRLRRLPLHRETDELRRAALRGEPPQLGRRAWFDEAGRPFRVFVRRVGETHFTAVEPERLRIANLDQPPPARPPATLTYRWWTPGAAQAQLQQAEAPITCAIDPETGRLAVAAPAPGTPEVEEVRVAYATSRGAVLGAGAQERGTTEQPFEIRDDGVVADLVWVVDSTAEVAGSAETGSRSVPSLQQALTEIAAQGAGRRSFVVLARCDIETPEGGASTVDVQVPTGSEVHLVAAEWRAPQVLPGVPADPGLRGFVIRRERRCTVAAPVRVQRGSGAPDAEPGRLVVDGLELTRGLRLAVRSVSGLELRHVTVRAPGGAAVTATGDLTAARISLTRSICGPVRLGSTTATVTGQLVVSDSVVATDGADTPALTAPAMDVSLRNVTVIGPSSMRSLEATNTLFSAPVTVTRRQSGCVRYSFVPHGSSTPRGFRCQPQLALDAARESQGSPLGATERDRVRLSVEPVLMDTSLDEPTLAMLHPLCPDAILLGGEDEAEIGAFAATGHAIARRNLVSLFDDFVPAALEAGVVDDTRSAAVTQRRNRP